MPPADRFMQRLKRTPPIVVDSALALGVVVVTLAELRWWLPARDPTVHPGSLDYALMSASGAALALRRRNLALAWTISRACVIPLALQVAFGDDIGIHILAAIMLYTIAERCSLRVAVAGWIAEYALMTVGVFVPPISGQVVFQGLFYFGFLFAFVWFAGRAQRYRERLTEELVVQTTQLVQEQEQLASQAVVAERRRIARDLQSLVIRGIESMARDTTAARIELASDPDQRPGSLEGIEATGRRTLEEMGRVLTLMDVAVESARKSPEV